MPIALGLAHQAGAIAVFATAVYHFWLLCADAPQAAATSHARGERLIEIGDDVGDVLEPDR